MRSKRLAPWQKDWVHANMLFEQAGLVQMEFELQRFAHLRDRLFDKHQALSQDPDPFTMQHVGVAFVLFACGIAMAITAFLSEIRAIGRAAFGRLLLTRKGK